MGELQLAAIISGDRCNAPVAQCLATFGVVHTSLLCAIRQTARLGLLQRA